MASARRLFALSALFAGLWVPVALLSEAPASGATIVGCGASALASAIATAASGTTLSLTAACSPYTLSAINNSTDGPTGLPVITNTLTIAGNGATINRSPSAPDFRLFDVEGAGNLTLSNLTLSGGSDTSGVGAGAIYEGNGTVTLNTVTVTANAASGPDCSSSMCQAAAGGGLFLNQGTLNLSDSTVSDNTVTEDNCGVNCGAIGGGIGSDGGTLAISDSTISGNSVSIDCGLGCSAEGGGIAVLSGSLALVTSTVADNELNSFCEAFCGGEGSAIYNGEASVALSNSTITGNSATAGCGFICGDEGALYAGSTPIALSATIVADNTGSSACAGDPSVDSGYNIDDDGSCNLSPAHQSIPDSATIDASLGTLASNGGPTDTVALSAPSPAIGVIPANGTVSNCPGNDQRNLPRPGSDKTMCDIGAFETQNGLALEPATLPNGTPGVRYTTTISAPGATPPVTFSVTSGALPPGLTLGSSSGVISGLPASADSGNYAFSVQGVDALSHTGTRSYTIDICAGRFRSC